MHIGFVFTNRAIEKREKLIGVNIKVGKFKSRNLKKEYPKCNFDDWFKERGVKLFAVKNNR